MCPALPVRQQSSADRPTAALLADWQGRLTLGAAALWTLLRRPRRAGTSIVAGAMVSEVPLPGKRPIVGRLGMSASLPNGCLARSAVLREGGGA